MPHDHHDHSDDTQGLSPSGHPYKPDQDHKLTRWQAMEIAMRELLIEKGIVTAAEITATVEQMDRRSPADGAKVVARAWVDPAFKARLLQNGTEAIREIGVEPGVLKLIAVENTPEVHNVVVCTLCSCYPRNLLGLPPDWYKQRAYRSRVVKTPRKVLAEFGLELPDTVQVRVHDSTADMRYLVLPARPEGTDKLDETALAALVSRDAMIGVATARHP
ncbi:nitrile hydratase subunit alpha [Neptunicoccus sediminis]|uniref:nitrile hydratase subunit alpha n=1 Tax=Neptunicoccus sediminis TaxID=1892596 RepID=UPI000845FDC5|nr:nitrile hydratase subunit alpha [Neptunicoccus sediminis]